MFVCFTLRKLNAGRKYGVYNTQKNHKTILIIDNLETDSGINDDVFQEKNLKRFQKFID